MEMAAVVTAVMGWVKSVIGIFLEPPTIYFVGVALVGAIAGMSKKFIPMRRR